MAHDRVANGVSLSFIMHMHRHIVNTFGYDINITYSDEQIHEIDTFVKMEVAVADETDGVICVFSSEMFADWFDYAYDSQIEDFIWPRMNEIRKAIDFNIRVLQSKYHIKQ